MSERNHYCKEVDVQLGRRGVQRATVRTAINVKRGAVAFRTGDSDSLLAAAKAEYANALSALPLVERDSRLGWEPSMEYCGGPRQIRWKLEQMKKLYGLETPEMR